MATIRRLLGATAILARDGGIPRPLRAVAALGLLPIPGPFDEVLLLLVGVVLVLFYRRPLREAWAQTAA